MCSEVFYQNASFGLGLQAHMIAGAEQLWDQQLQGAFYVSREGMIVKRNFSSTSNEVERESGNK